MSHDSKSLLKLGLVSAAGLTIRLITVFAPPPFALVLASFLGASLFITGTILLGMGLAIAIVGSV